MPRTSYTLAELQDRLVEKWEKVPFWTREESRLFLNEGLRVWNMLTGVWKRRLVFSTIAAEPWYALPSTLTYSVRVQFNEYPLGQSSIYDLDHGRNGWEADLTISGGTVPTRPVLWAPAGLRLIAIWPADYHGCNSLVIDGVRDTPVLRNFDDYVDLGEEEYHSLLGYALHIATFKRGGAEFTATTPFHKEFLIAAANVNDRLKTSAFFRKYMGLDHARESRPMRQQEISVGG
jgi:hypothetical protein